MAEQKILVVEDDPLIAADIVSTLTNFGYQVLGPLADGESVIQKFTDLKPDFVLMDIGLGGKLDGIQTAEALQPLGSVPLVFLTAFNDETTLQRAKLANPYGYLIKPFDSYELRSTIELTLHRFHKEVVDGQSEDEGESLSSPKTVLEPTSGSSALVEHFKELKFFRGVPAEMLAVFAQRCAIRELEAGEFIVSEGDIPEGGFIPLTGRISITKTSETGKELIVALLAPGDVVGLFYSLDAFGGATSARTQVASRIIWVPKSQLSFLLEQYPPLYQAISECLSNQLTASYTLSSSLAHARVEGRIISALLALLPSFGKSNAKSLKEGRIYITRKELSELTGTTPETAIRVTKNLEREGMLDLTRPGIIKIPDIEKLRASAKG